MILNEEKEGWHYLAARRAIISKYVGRFYWFSCLHTFKTKSKELKLHEKVCKNKDICGIVMSSRKNNILEFNIGIEGLY